MKCVEDISYDENQKVWKYLKLNRFIELFETSKLYFASANEFDDEFEGAVAVLPATIPIDPRYRDDPSDRAFKALKRLTKITCWHIENKESSIMWDLYSDKGKGIAIETTPLKIENSLTPYKTAPTNGDEDLYAGNIKYVDLLTERFNFSWLGRFFYKDIAFSAEKEFRTAISLRLAEEHGGIRVENSGILLDINLSEMITAIHIGNSISDEDFEKIKSVCREQNLEDRIVESRLRGTPKFH